jgi:NAD(P)-dependent dehydrogenase (short-subunit alcohol dehydrogenase family)
MKNKIVLVTGANRGLGFEIARQLGEKRFHVIITGRDDEKLIKAHSMLESAGIQAEMILMDVDQDYSIQKATGILSMKNIRLDILINNAGITLKNDKSLVSSEFDVLEKIINTNSFGTLRVTRALLPLMNDYGRIINISSGGGSMTDPVEGWSPAYCVSKTLLNAMTRHLANELSVHNISVNAVCPGWVKTDMGGKYAPRSVEKGAETPVWLASEAPIELTGKFLRDKKTIPW